MKMAGQHQVDIVRCGPIELVGRMGEQDSQRQAGCFVRWAVAEIGGRAEPGQFVAGQDERRVANRYLYASGRRRMIRPASASAAWSRCSIDAAVVVAEHVVDATRGSQPAERVWNPVEARVAIRPCRR